jgi:hypothetical protein
MRAVTRLLRECHMWGKNVTRAGMDGGPAAARVFLALGPISRAHENSLIRNDLFG